MYSACIQPILLKTSSCCWWKHWDWTKQWAKRGRTAPESCRLGDNSQWLCSSSHIVILLSFDSILKANVLMRNKHSKTSDKRIFLSKMWNCEARLCKWISAVTPEQWQASVIETLRHPSVVARGPELFGDSMCVWAVGELKRARCRPESIRVREKGSSEVPINWQRFQKVWMVAAEAFYRGAAAAWLTPSNHTVGQLVSLPNGAAGKGITAMADHDEKCLTSKMMYSKSSGLWQVIIFGTIFAGGSCASLFYHVLLSSSVLLAVNASKKKWPQTRRRFHQGHVDVFA